MSIKKKGMQDNSFFSYENLDELTDFTSHLEYTERTIKKYDWNPDVKKKLETSLKQIKDKQADDKLTSALLESFLQVKAHLSTLC